MTSRKDATCYLERSEVRKILIGHNAATQALLPKIDALPIFTAADIADVAQTSLDPDDKSLSNIADWLEQKGVVGSAKIVRGAALALRTNAQAPSDLARRHDAEMADVTGQLFDAWNEIKALKASAQAVREPVSSMRAQWTYDPEVHAYYFAPVQASPPPYNTREVTAIIDIANDGTLAGVELIDNMPPPPSSVSSTEHQSHPVWEDENRWMCEHGRQGGCSCRFTCKGYGAVSSTEHS